MSLGLVVLEKKLSTRTPTPQSDDIMSADIKTKAETGFGLHTQAAKPSETRVVH